MNAYFSHRVITQRGKLRNTIFGPAEREYIRIARPTNTFPTAYLKTNITAILITNTRTLTKGITQRIVKIR